MVVSHRKDDHWPAIKEVMQGFRSLECPFPVRGLFELKPSTIPNLVMIVKKMLKQELVSRCSRRMRTALIANSCAQRTYPPWAGILNAWLEFIRIMKS